MRVRQVVVVLMTVALFSLGLWNAPVLFSRITTKEVYCRIPTQWVERITIHRWRKEDSGEPRVVRSDMWNELTGSHFGHSGAAPWWGGDRTASGKVVEISPWSAAELPFPEWWKGLPADRKVEPKIFMPSRF